MSELRLIDLANKLPRKSSRCTICLLGSDIYEQIEEAFAAGHNLTIIEELLPQIGVSPVPSKSQMAYHLRHRGVKYGQGRG